MSAKAEVKRIDVRGLPCPQPVLRSRKAMMESDRVEVLISDKAQVGNVSRMARRSEWRVSVQELEDGFHVILEKEESSPAEPVAPGPEDLICAAVKERVDAAQISGTNISDRGSVLVISSDKMGRDADQLGDLLMKAFLNTLLEVDRRPEKILFYNTGVRLAVEGSKVLEDLKVLERSGVEMLVCGTCLNFFNLTEHIRVGVVSNMYDIASELLSGRNVVTI